MVLREVEHMLPHKLPLHYESTGVDKQALRGGF